MLDVIYTKDDLEKAYNRGFDMSINTFNIDLSFETFVKELDNEKTLEGI